MTPTSTTLRESERPTVPNLELLPPFEACLIDYWVHDTHPGLQALVTSVHSRLLAAGDTRRTRRQVEGNLRSVWPRLGELGLYASQAAKNGVRASLADKTGNAVHWLNLSAVAVEQATFETITRAFLGAASDHAPAQAEQARLRTALRLLLDLPARCDDETIHRAARTVPVAEVIMLPARVMEKAKDATQSLQSRKNLRTAMRAAMRHAAMRRLCPIVFRPEPVPSDEWMAVMSTHFPLTEEGTTPSATRHARKGIREMALACEQAFKTPPTPDTITWEQVDRVVDFLRHEKGKAGSAREVRSTARKLAARGVGKLALPAGAMAFTVATPSGPRPAIYLRDVAGRAHAHSWRGALDVIASHGLPTETIELLEWYGEWVTAPAETFLMDDCPWPAVLPRHRLSHGSLGKRGLDLRAWIGCAIHVCNLDPTTLTPSRLFGQCFDQIGKALARWWLERAQAIQAERKKYGTAMRGGLHHIIVSAGIVAYAGYVRERHQSGQHALVRATASEKHVDVTQETSVVKTPVEDRFWTGYTKSLEHAANVKLLRLGNRATGRKANVDAKASHAPEFKDIHRVVAHTPPAWWLALLDGMHGQIRAEVSAGRDDGKAFHHLVQDAWELGALISTGLRGEEACRLRLGVHLMPGDTRVRLSADERKNVKRQSAFIQERFVPPDIHELYLNRTLPWLKRGQFEGHAERHEARRKPGWQDLAASARARAQHHDFLIVNRDGAAPGARLLAAAAVLSDGADSEGVAAAMHQFKVVVGSHGVRWKGAMMARAVEGGLTLPENLDYEFGRHCIRGAFGYAIFQTLGLVAAANYLGDTTTTVETAYSGVDGANVDVTAVATFKVPDRGIALSGGIVTAQRELSTSSALPMHEPGTRQEKDVPGYELLFMEKEEQLRADLRAGLISREQYEDRIERYARLFHCERLQPTRAA